jgi:hypothetical protein
VARVMLRTIECAVGVFMVVIYMSTIVLGPAPAPCETT